MQCADAREWMSYALDNALTPTEEQKFLAHLAECPACRQEFQELKALIEELRAIPQLELPEGYHEELMEKLSAAVPNAAPKKKRSLPGWQRYGALAAGFLVLVAVGLTASNGLKPNGSSGSGGPIPPAMASKAAANDFAEGTDTLEATGEAAEAESASESRLFSAKPENDDVLKNLPSEEAAPADAGTEGIAQNAGSQDASLEGSAGENGLGLDLRGAPPADSAAADGDSEKQTFHNQALGGTSETAPEADTEGIPEEAPEAPKTAALAPNALEPDADTADGASPLESEDEPPAEIGEKKAPWAPVAAAAVCAVALAGGLWYYRRKQK